MVPGGGSDRLVLNGRNMCLQRRGSHILYNYIVVVLIKHKTHGLSNLVRNSHFRTREPAFVYPTCSSNFSCLYFYI